MCAQKGRPVQSQDDSTGRVTLPALIPRGSPITLSKFRAVVPGDFWLNPSRLAKGQECLCWRIFLSCKESVQTSGGPFASLHLSRACLPANHTDHTRCYSRVNMMATLGSFLS